MLNKILHWFGYKAVPIDWYVINPAQEEVKVIKKSNIITKYQIVGTRGYILTQAQEEIKESVLHCVVPFITYNREDQPWAEASCLNGQIKIIIHK